MTSLLSVSPGAGIALVLVVLAALWLIAICIGEWLDVRQGRKVSLVVTRTGWRRFKQLRKWIAPWRRHPLTLPSMRNAMVLDAALELYDKAVTAELGGNQLVVRDPDGTTRPVFECGNED